MKTRPTTRPTKQKDGLPYPAFGEFRMRHNVAHDMLRVVQWAVKAKDKDFNRVFPRDTRPLIALIFACSAIEGYTNYVGKSMMEDDWLAFLKGQTPGQKRKAGITDKIKRIYDKLAKEVSFDSGIFHDVSDLFDIRGYLMHPSVDECTLTGTAPPADILEMIGEDYPPAKVASLADDFRKKILQDSKVRDFESSIGFTEKISAP
jgi:hypothetical protein